MWICPTVLPPTRRAGNEIVLWPVLQWGARRRWAGGQAGGNEEEEEEEQRKGGRRVRWVYGKFAPSVPTELAFLPPLLAQTA